MAQEVVDKLVGKIINGYQDKFKIAVVGIARRKIRALIKTADIVDLLLDRLNDLRNQNLIETMNAQQIIRLLSELNNSTNRDLEFIMKLVSPDSELKELQVLIDNRSINLNGASQATELKADEILKITGASRDKIREAFDVLLNGLKPKDNEEIIDFDAELRKEENQ